MQPSNVCLLYVVLICMRHARAWYGPVLSMNGVPTHINPRSHLVPSKYSAVDLVNAM
jgi:hypothetical protein